MIKIECDNPKCEAKADSSTGEIVENQFERVILYGKENGMRVPRKIFHMCDACHHDLTSQIDSLTHKHVSDYMGVDIPEEILDDQSIEEMPEVPGISHV